MKLEGKRQSDNYRDMRDPRSRKKKTLLSQTQKLQGRAMPPPDVDNPLSRAAGAHNIEKAVRDTKLKVAIQQKYHRNKKTSRNPFAKAAD